MPLETADLVQPLRNAAITRVHAAGEKFDHRHRSLPRARRENAVTPPSNVMKSRRFTAQYLLCSERKE